MPSPYRYANGYSNCDHFGRDDCRRVQALRHVGYKVRESDSLDRLGLHLVRKKDVDAVIVSEMDPLIAEQAAVLVRQHCGAPLILFRLPDVAIDERRFDRVISSSAPEALWLFDTAVLVMQSKQLRGQCERLRNRSQVLVTQ